MAFFPVYLAVFFDVVIVDIDDDIVIVGDTVALSLNRFPFKLHYRGVSRLEGLTTLHLGWCNVATTLHLLAGVVNYTEGVV